MDNKLSSGLRQLVSSGKLQWIIIGIAILLRLVRYMHNPSLWFDEADTAVDIIGRTFSELIEPSPDWSSKYPYGHLLLVKSAVQLFGNSEYALRLVPLIFGIFSVLLFHRVAKLTLDAPAALVALGLFTVSEPLVFQASNLKPYSGDMAIGLLIILWAYSLKGRKLTFSGTVLASAAGAVMIWLSHSSLFVLVGVGMCFAVPALLNRDWRRFSKLTGISVVWAVSFLACYFLYLKKLISNFDMSIEDLLVIERSFVTFPPKSLKDVQHITEMFFDIFTNPLGPIGFAFAGLSALVFIVGCFSLYRKNREIFFLIMAPVIVTLFASIMHKYPFKGRLLVFIAPIVILFMAEGAEHIRKKTGNGSIIVGALVIGLLFFHPATMACYRLKRPFYYEDVRPVMKHIRDNWTKGDMIYVYYYSQYVFEYYTRYHPERFHLNEEDYVIGIAPRGWYRTWRKNQVSKYYNPDEKGTQTPIDIYNKYIEDLNKLKGHKRVWLLFTGKVMKDGMHEEKFFVHYLKSIGKQLDSFGKAGVSSAYLYDLSEK